MDLNSIPLREDIVNKIVQERIILFTPDSIRQISAEDLKNEKIYERLFITFIDPQFGMELGDSSEMIFVLQNLIKGFQEQDPKLYLKYQDLVIYGMFRTMPVRGELEITWLLRNFLVKAFYWELPVEELFYNMMVFKGFPFDLLVVLRQRMIQSIRENKEKIGKMPIGGAYNLDDGLKQTKESTVGNWLVDFEAFFNSSSLHSPVEEVSYINQGKNVRNLAPAEKNLILKVIRVYDYLRFPTPLYTPTTGHMVEEEIVDRVKPVSAETIDPEKQREKLIEEFLGSEGERIMIHDAETGLEQLNNGNLSAIVETFMSAVDQKDKYKAIAALRIIAEKGDLVAELKLNERISAFTKSILQNEYKREVVADFQRNGFTAPYFSVFLQNIFKEKMGLDDAESARFGVQLENMLVEKGQTSVQGMVYGDLASGKYVWQEVKDEGVKLSIPNQV
ncbi:MAG: hypothetical protein WC693_04800 [Patescibacteria group bacterium]|jgi:hypothetical protein